MEFNMSNRKSANASDDVSKTATIQLLHAIQLFDIISVQEILSLINSDLINVPCGPLQVTAIQIACSLPVDKSLTAVRLLLSHGANSASKDKLGRTPLHSAATYGNVDLVLLLLENGADINSKYQLNTAPLKNYVESDLIDTLPLPECWGRTPLHQAVKGNHKTVVKLLLGRGALVNEEDEHGVTPLLLAGAGIQKETLPDYEDMVATLILNEADVNVSNNHTGTTPLHHAVALGSLAATEYLLQAGALIKDASCGQTPLHEAAGRGNVAILTLLLQHETLPINRPDTAGRTVLHKAAFACSRDCIMLLVNHGGDLSAETKTKISVIDALFKHVPRPMHLITEILDSKITCNGSLNSVDFKVTLDFKVLAPRGSNRQMSVIASILDAGNTSQTIQLLQHPLIESYLRLKWNRLRIFFALLVIIHVVFVLSLSTYIILIVHEPKWAEFLLAVSRHVLLLSAFALFTHAVIQCALVPRQYYRQYEMLLNLVCAFMSFVIAIVGDQDATRGIEEEKKPHEAPASWVLHTMSVTVLLAWIELMLLVGRFPTYGYYALMFSTVLQNVVKVLLTFVCLVIGFALSFSVQFHSYEQFQDPWRAIVKTTVMMMGEFEYADLFADGTVDGKLPMRLPGTSRFIFLIFIILASIVLMNLMVGLAVNDIQALQTEGHVQRLAKQATFLSHLETVLSHKILRSDWMPSGLYKLLYSRRCINTTLVLRPGQVAPGRDGDSNWKNLIPLSLMESIVTIAIENTKAESTPDEVIDVKSIMSMLRQIETQIIQLQNSIPVIYIKDSKTDKLEE